MIWYSDKGFNNQEKPNTSSLINPANNTVQWSMNLLTIRYTCDHHWFLSFFLKKKFNWSNQQVTKIVKGHTGTATGWGREKEGDRGHICRQAEVTSVNRQTIWQRLREGQRQRSYRQTYNMTLWQRPMTLDRDWERDRNRDHTDRHTTWHFDRDWWHLTETERGTETETETERQGF